MHRARTISPSCGTSTKKSVMSHAARRTAGTTGPIWIGSDPAALRVLALKAAATTYQGKGGTWGTDTILQAADDFTAWLATGERPERFEPAPPPPDPGQRRRS